METTFEKSTSLSKLLSFLRFMIWSSIEKYMSIQGIQVLAIVKIHKIIASAIFPELLSCIG
jgi:hypothetical protein